MFRLTSLNYCQSRLEHKTKFTADSLGKSQTQSVKIGFYYFKTCTIHDIRSGTRKISMFIKANFFFITLHPIPMKP